jgi:hypothetical protein
MKIKETILNISIIIVLITGVVVSLMWAANSHHQIKQREIFVRDSIKCANAMKTMRDSTEYQFNVTDDSVTVYDYGRVVGTIKLDGTLDSLITLDNQ